jgi:hypothetical protein
MAELDGVKEQLVYLRLWLGIIVVADRFDRVGRFGGRNRDAKIVLARDCWHHGARLRRLTAASTDRAAYRRDSEPVGVDLVIGIVIVAVAVLFVGIALDAARRK